MHQFNTKQDELEYWAEVETAAKKGISPDHDCHAGPEDGCQVCADYHESRAWWIEQQSKKTNQALL